MRGGKGGGGGEGGDREGGREGGRGMRENLWREEGRSDSYIFTYTSRGLPAQPDACPPSGTLPTGPTFSTLCVWGGTSILYIHRVHIRWTLWILESVLLRYVLCTCS